MMKSRNNTRAAYVSGIGVTVALIGAVIGTIEPYAAEAVEALEEIPVPPFEQHPLGVCDSDLREAIGVCLASAALDGDGPDTCLNGAISTHTACVMDWCRASDDRVGATAAIDAPMSVEFCLARFCRQFDRCNLVDWATEQHYQKCDDDAHSAYAECVEAVYAPDPAPAIPFPFCG